MSDPIRSERVERALTQCLESGKTDALFEELRRASGLPGPRPSFDLAQSVGATIAAQGKRGASLVAKLKASIDNEFLLVVYAFACAEAVGLGRPKATHDKAGLAAAIEALHDLCDDDRAVVREGVVLALRALLRAHPAEVVEALVRFTDGYLHAHVAIEALTDKTWLTSVHDPEPLLSRLDEAFRLADESPRAAERSQGVRTLRRDLPAQISRLAGRFPNEVIPWVAARATWQRPETREVVAETIRTLRKRSLPKAEADRLAQALSGSAPEPRDPTRIVQGTRNRSRGR